MPVRIGYNYFIIDVRFIVVTGLYYTKCACGMALLRNYSIYCCYLLFSQTIRTILCSSLLTILQQLFDTQNTPCSSVQSTITIHIVTSLTIQRVMAPLYARRLLYSHEQLAIVLIGIEYFHCQLLAFSCSSYAFNCSVYQYNIILLLYTPLPCRLGYSRHSNSYSLAQFNTINKLQRKLEILLC